uniref:Homologous-pairing protein 2 homolog n=1 Tax=Oryza rufipogon TaxID=4529 RepID=A0A0E0P0B0_ORYRU
MASEEAARSHLSRRKHRRSPRDDDDEDAAEDGASSLKRHKRDHHRHRHRGEGDLEGAAGVATVSPAAAGPAEGEAEDGEILDQATAAVGVDVGVGVGRGLDADAGEAGSVRGVLPAPEHGDNSDADLNIHVNELHTSQLARNPSQEHDYPAKSDHAAHEAIVEYHSRRSPGLRNHNEAHSKDCLRSCHASRETGFQTDGSRNSVRLDYEHGIDDRHGELDRYSTRRWETEERGCYKKRKNSGCHIGRHTDICNSEEKHLDERKHGSLVEKKVDLHGLAYHERRSGDGRFDQKASAHHGHGEGREMDRWSSSTRKKDEEWRNRKNDTARNSYKETDRVGSRYGEEKLTDSIDKRDKRGFRGKEMDACWSRAVNGNEGSISYTHANYGMSGIYKDGSSFGGDDTKAKCKRRPEEEKKEPYMEEDEENYLEKIEDRLAKTKEHESEKIKDESKKGTEDILEKQQEKSAHCIDNKEITKINKEPAATKQRLNNLRAKEEIAKNHELSNVFVGAKFCNVRKSPTLPKISISLEILDNKRATSASGLQEGSLGVSHNKRMANASGLQEGIPMRGKQVIVGNKFDGQQRIGRKLGNENNMLAKKNTLHNNWEDEEGYYIYHFGEVLQGRYEITARRGKGVFSTVVNAKDLKAQKDGCGEVAIKIICNNIEKSGKREISILEKMATADCEDKRHCKFGHGNGLKLTAVRVYARQIFIALKHLRHSGVLHCDIKPDNILVNKDGNWLKLCDFGSAMSAGNNEITPYLVSRFYRAPEIILGLPYDHPLDMWSAGCCLSELYTGKILFDGSTNNDMLRLHMELKGPFPKKMLRKGAFTMQHFDQNMNFLARKKDPITKTVVNRLLLNIKPKGVGSAISSCPGDDPKMISSFKDLLEKIFVLDPKKRITVSEALSHPFITGNEAAMPPKSDSVEGIVLSFVNEQNRPLNSQNAADALQKFSLKKTAVQKALDALADSGQISFKEYGKQKIYLARQDQFNIPNGEELEEMKKANIKLQEELADQKKAIGEVESEVRGLQSNLTLAEIKSKEAKLQREVHEMEEKLNKLRSGVILVKPEDKKIIEESFSEKVNQWRKRKRMFKELWDNITENSPKDQKEFKEELGIEYDEDVGVNLQSYSDMLTSLSKRRKVSR